MSRIFATTALLDFAVAHGDDQVEPRTAWGSVAPLRQSLPAAAAPQRLYHANASSDTPPAPGLRARSVPEQRDHVLVLDFKPVPVSSRTFCIDPWAGLAGDEKVT